MKLEKQKQLSVLHQKSEDQLQKHSSQGYVKDTSPVAADCVFGEVCSGRIREKSGDVEASDHDGKLPEQRR